MAGTARGTGGGQAQRKGKGGKVARLTCFPRSLTRAWLAAALESTALRVEHRRGTTVEAQGQHSRGTGAAQSGHSTLGTGGEHAQRKGELTCFCRSPMRAWLAAVAALQPRAARCSSVCAACASCSA